MGREGKGTGQWAPSQGGLALCHFWEQNSEGGENSKFEPRILGHQGDRFVRIEHKIS